MKDYCGQYKRKIFVLVSALKNRVADDLLKTSANVPQSLLFARLHKRLEDELAMTAEAAHWAVESWALALDVINQPLPVVKPPVSPPSPPPPPPKVAPTSPPRTEAALIAGRYRDHGDGTVTDIETGLQWMRFSLGQEWKDGSCTVHAKEYTWQEAVDATEALNRQGRHADYLDWNIPTIDKLKTLLNSSSVPIVNQLAFPNTQGRFYWSSSADTGSLNRAW